MSVKSISKLAPDSRVSLVDALLGWRSIFSFGRLEAIVLTIYILVLAITIPHHEAWSDEAQAWMLARDNTLWQLLRYRLHYEGTPGLWHLVLHLFQQMGGRYAGMSWLGACFATVGIIILLRWSPFPLIVRLLLPFTFFLQYQYAVIGRSYTLFPLLVFSLCALFYSRRNSLWFAFVAGLLANLSLQGTVVSFFLLGLYLFHRYRRSRRMGDSFTLLPPVTMYLIFFGLATVTAVPAPDVGIVNGGSVTTGTVQDLLERFPGPLPADQKLPPPPSYALHSAIIIPPPPPALQTVRRPEPAVLLHPAAWAVWYLHGENPESGGYRRALEVTLELLTLATAPVSTYKFLACGFLTVLLVWLYVRRALAMLVPWVGNIIVGEALWISDHHLGILLIALLVAIWLAVPPSAAESESLRAIDMKLDRTFVALLTLTCVLQMVWAMVSIRKEIGQPYDPSPETAAFLLEHSHKRMAAFDFGSIGVEPYFPQNPFFNYSQGYWVWATNDNPNHEHLATVAQHPDIVLFTEDLLASGYSHNDWATLSPLGTTTQNSDLDRNSIIIDLRANGYRETHRFCGDRFMRLDASYRACHLIFEPAQVPLLDP